MEFFIRKNATLPIIEVDIIKDGKLDYNYQKTQLSASTIYFSMKDVETGFYRITNGLCTFDTETYGEQRTLYTADFPGNFPATTNVRQGTVFGDTSQFTGTVAIPSASNVLKGVPVDTTTGSASFTTQNVWSVLTSSLSATGSIGERLVSASTVATDANLITLTGTL